MKQTQNKKIGKTINTAMGEAVYSHTEVEDSQERWDDHWKFSAGEFVIHNGEEHDVFLLIKQTCGYCGQVKNPINLCCCGGRCYEGEVN